MPKSSAYTLTPALAAAHAGGPVLCLADAAYGQTFRLHAARPRYDRDRDVIRRADVIGPDGLPLNVNPMAGPVVSRVEIRGPLEQYAGFYDCASGYSDGYDAIAERMLAALEAGDVHVTFDTPGGAVLGLPECCDAIVEAKTRLGRRITGCIAGMCGSAGMWLACAIVDAGEFYITRGSQAGSIGARACHADQSGALAMEGLALTDFAYPPGKIALSPNRPLSEVGKARGERDVMGAFEAFAATVSASRPLLTHEAIVKLDADMLTGAAAVAAGLADGVATVEEVEAWAMARATGEAMADEKDPADKAEMPEKPGASAEDEAPPSKPGHEEPDGDEGKCKRCGEMPGKEARYCAKCGAKVAEDKPEPAAEDEEEARAKAAAPGSVASMLGLRPGASDVAIKTALVPLLAFASHVKRTLGVATLDAARGALRATIEDAAAGVKAKADLRIERARNDERERWDLVGKLLKANAYPRSDLYVDEVDEKGDRKAVALSPQFAEMKMGTLRGLAQTKTANAAPPKAPWQPDRKEAETVAASGGMTMADAMKHPVVVASATRPGALPIEKIAASFLATHMQNNSAQGAQNGAKP